MVQVQVVGVLQAVLLLAASGGEAKPETSVTVELRAAPRVASAPVRVVFTVELAGGTDDALRCLVFDWEWGDGTRSTQEGECPPEDAAVATPTERTFQASHEYRTKSRPEVKLKVRQGDRLLGKNGIELVIGAPRAKTKFEIKQG